MATSIAPAQQRSLREVLESRTEEFGKALVGRIGPGAFVRVAYTTITKTPKLAECRPESILMALLECAGLGLMPNGVMGEAYLVPYGQQAQFIPGYRGLIKLARQSGVVQNMVPGVVRQGDRFEVTRGISQTLVHVPDLDVDDSKPELVTHVYVIARFADGGEPMFDVMGRGAVERIRRRSKSANNGPWVTDWEAMAIKTVIRRLFKYLPASDHDLSRALEADNSDFVDVSELTPSGARGTGGARLADRFAPALAAVQEERPDFAELDGAGLTAGSDAESGSSDGHEAGTRGKLFSLARLVANVQPSSGSTAAADDGQRVSIRRLALVLATHDNDTAERMLHLAAPDFALSSVHAKQVIASGEAAAAELGIAVAL